MGFGIIIFGFMCLHFHFLDMYTSHIGDFPLSISLIILVLGFLYEYQRTHKKEYLSFMGLSCLIVSITFMKDIRMICLLLQTFLYTLFLLFVRKEFVNYQKQKKLYTWTIIYAISGIINALTLSYEYNFGQFGHNINVFSSIIASISVITTLIHLFRIKKLLNIESRPQPAAIKKPIYIHVMVVLVCIIPIVFTQYSLSEHAYNQAIKYNVYQLSNDQIEMKYLTDFYVTYPNGALSCGSSIMDLQLKTSTKPQYIEIIMNNQTISQGNINYKDDKTYQYYQQYASGIAFTPQTIPDCEIIIDGVSYQTKIKKVTLDEYKYEDSHIKISHCFIPNGQVILLPRIEIFQQDIVIQNIQIVDKDGHLLIDAIINKYDQQYRDGVTFYHEMPAIDPLSSKEGPYQIKISYQYQDNYFKKEYPLTLYETSLP